MKASTTFPRVVATLIVAGIPTIVTLTGIEISRSSTVANQLASVMSGRQLEAFATQDPENPNRFHAVLLIPNVQLLAVSADYPNIGELQAQLTNKNYRDVYAALHQPAAQQSRFFLMDLGCDGLRGDSDAVDVLYEKGTIQTIFNGDWKKQGLSEAAYKQKLVTAESQYVQVLTTLAHALNAR